MTICSNCHEYEAVSGDRCSICKWQEECEGAQAQVAALVMGITTLPITVGSMKKIKNKFIPELLNKLDNFNDRTPPNAATPIGFTTQEDVTEITSRIKEVAWENLCSSAKTGVEIIGLRFPPLIKESGLAQLSSLIDKEQSESIIVSVIADWGGPENVASFMNSLGFAQVEDIDMSHIRVEVTGGYFSYLRGDAGASSRNASVFTAERYQFLEDHMFKKHDFYVGMSKYKGRRVMHLVGAKDNLPKLLFEIISNPSARTHYGSFVGDLEIALRHWEDIDLTRLAVEKEKDDEPSSRRSGGGMLDRIVNWFIRK